MNENNLNLALLSHLEEFRYRQTEQQAFHEHNSNIYITCMLLAFIKILKIIQHLQRTVKKSVKLFFFFFSLCREILFHVCLKCFKHKS